MCKAHTDNIILNKADYISKTEAKLDDKNPSLLKFDWNSTFQNLFDIFCFYGLLKFDRKYYLMRLMV